MTSGFLVFSFVAQVILWIFAVRQIENARQVAWRLSDKERRLDEIHKASQNYIEAINAEQESICRRLGRVERRLNDIQGDEDCN
jgi:biopolymer transport protein ExbB/TolQ